VPNALALLARLQTVCEMIATRLGDARLNRRHLIDTATALLLISNLLDRTDVEIVGYARTDEPLHPAYALHELRACAVWLRHESGTASDAQLRERLTEGLRHATEALSILRRSGLS